MFYFSENSGTYCLFQGRIQDLSEGGARFLGSKKLIVRGKNFLT